MKKNQISALPILNNEKNILSIVFLDNKKIDINEHNLKIPIVIMAGGLGTRLHPYTKILPKALIPIGEKPIIEIIIDKFSYFGSREFHLILNHKKNMIKAYFNEIQQKNYVINYVDELTQLGTGGGISLLKGKINSTFFLTNCDILIEDNYEEIYNFHIKQKNFITVISSLKKIIIPYGVIEINNKGEIEKMNEKTEFSFFVNTGMYIVEPQVIDQIELGKPFGFPTIIENFIKLGKKIGFYPISDQSWFDMGQISGLEEIVNKYKVD
jgi:NDP-sugar pyrophosphorylase family protein